MYRPRSRQPRFPAGASTPGAKKRPGSYQIAPDQMDRNREMNRKRGRYPRSLAHDDRDRNI